MSRKALFLTVVVLLFLTVVGLGAYVKFEGQTPVCQFVPGVPEVIGLKTDFTIRLGETGQGLKSARLEIIQGNARQLLVDEAWPGRYGVLGSRMTQAEIPVSIDPKALSLTDGPATLRLEVRDHAWRNSFHGNTFLFEKQVQVDTTPPRISVVPNQTYVRAGGCGLVLFRVAEPVNAGVRIGDDFFQAVPVAGQKGLYQCLFAAPYNVEKGVRALIVARDAAGNTTDAGFNHVIRKRRYKHSKINITARFLSRTIPKFRRHGIELPEDEVEAFLYINRILRRQNGETIRRLTAKATPERLWEGGFLQLKNSARTASYGDHRSYFHNGREIDRQVHMGLDLASTSAAPINAANNGRVVFSDWLGIYGLCVIIDHGQGLYSLYGHLSTIAVTAGAQVTKGDLIGQSGVTGLAGGDHLHFGMICGGVYVDPIEWLDPRWIRHNVTDKIKVATGDG